MSAFTLLQYIQVHFRLVFFMDANNINPYQTTSKKEQFDLGSYCLQYRLPKNISRHEEQTTKVVTGGLMVIRDCGT